MSTGYAYDQAWEHERARLAGIEAMWDPGTQALLARHGASRGARVFEAGAGGGSVVEWLAGQVGAEGHVLAVDLDVRFMQHLASPVVEVRTADLVSDELPARAYDVVHTRLVLEHIPVNEQVLARLVDCLRPGGTIVVEDYDWTAFGIDAADDQDSAHRVTEGILSFMAAMGFDRHYGRKLVSSLTALGLEDVQGEGRSLVIDADHPGYAFFQLSFEQLAPLAIEAGMMSQPDADVVGARFAHGDARIITPTLMAGIGRRG
ncbi:MAG: class I SAM-dependent methyltransferase [Actinomycetes bacterium]